LKKFCKAYINNFPGASEMRVMLMQCKTSEEFHEQIEILVKAQN